MRQRYLFRLMQTKNLACKGLILRLINWKEQGTRNKGQGTRDKVQGTKDEVGKAGRRNE